MKRVLLAEDVPALRYVYGMTLIKSGFDVMAVSNSIDAIELFDRVDFDLVVIDIDMLQADEKAVSHFIRSLNRPYTPIVAVSANIELCETHCDAFLLKPFPLTMFVEILEKISVR